MAHVTCSIGFKMIRVDDLMVPDRLCCAYDPTIQTQTLLLHICFYYISRCSAKSLITLLHVNNLHSIFLHYRHRTFLYFSVYLSYAITFLCICNCALFDLVKVLLLLLLYPVHMSNKLRFYLFVKVCISSLHQEPHQVNQP
jgi:hypothetical protein